MKTLDYLISRDEDYFPKTKDSLIRGRACMEVLMDFFFNHSNTDSHVSLESVHVSV